jgi:hypothetical protein
MMEVGGKALQTTMNRKVKDREGSSGREVSTFLELSVPECLKPWLYYHKTETIRACMS